MKPIDWVYEIIEHCRAKGVHEFCFCSGSRNAYFIEILSKREDLKTYSFFDERSAGFLLLEESKAMESQLLFAQHLALL